MAEYYEVFHEIEHLYGDQVKSCGLYEGKMAKIITSMGNVCHEEMKVYLEQGYILGK